MREGEKLKAHTPFNGFVDGLFDGGHVKCRIESTERMIR